MSRRTGLTALFLLAVIAAILAALVVEASRGPSFRAASYGSWDECVNGIPEEWERGSLPYTQAEAACGYVHGRTGRQSQ